VLAGRVPFNVADGLIRMAIFLGFLYAISFWKDIRRVFEYHGAEHKVVFNFESGQPVTVPNAQRFTRYHPRCGTSFLFVVLILAIPIYTLIPFDGFLPRLLSRIALLPLIAGLSYEVIRFAAKRRGSLLATLAAPGCGCSASPPNRRPTTRRRWPFARSKAPWPSKRRKADNWSSPDHPCNSFPNSISSKNASRLSTGRWRTRP